MEDAAREVSGPRLWQVALVAGLVAFALLGSRPLWEPTETRYALAAHEMLRSGNYLLPTLHGEPHLSKPPLTYWLSAMGQAALGVNPWGARLLLAPAFILTALSTALLGERLFGTERGRWAGILHATMLVPACAASVLTADTILVLFETAGVMCLVRGWWSGRSRPWVIAGWACFGLAFATKGPPALLPIAALVIACLLSSGAGRSKLSLWRLFDPVGPLLLLLLGGAWFAFVLLIDASASQVFLGDELLGRLTAGGHNRNPGLWHAFRLYLPALTIGTLPWAHLWPALVRRALRRDEWRSLRARPDALLLACWLLVPLAVFTLAPSKLVLYVLPLFVPLALLLAAPLARPETRGWITGRGAWLLALAVLALASVRLGASLVEAPRDASLISGFVQSLVTDPRDELVSVDRTIHGPDLLLGIRTENVRLLDERTIDTEGQRGIAEELAELKDTDHRHVFLYVDLKKPRFEALLAEHGEACRIVDGPSRYLAAICEPTRPRPALRVALAVEPHAGAAERLAFVRRLRRLDGERRLDGAVIVLAPPLGLPQSLALADRSRAYWSLTEQRGVQAVFREWSAAAFAERQIVTGARATASLELSGREVTMFLQGVGVTATAGEIRILEIPNRDDSAVDGAADAIDHRVEDVVGDGHDEQGQPRRDGEAEDDGDAHRAPPE